MASEGNNSSARVIGRLSSHGAGRVLDAKSMVRQDLCLYKWNKNGWAKKPEATAPPPVATERRCPLIDGRTISPEEFSKRYAEPNEPVLLSHLLDEWPAWKKWTLERLYKHYRHVMFRVGDDNQHLAINLKFKYFVQYLLDNDDDSPLYIFDHKGIRKGKGARLLKHYSVPSLFRDDLFHYVSELRPMYRWLLIGPERSGSSLHIDPLGTSAWNALIKGHKRWVLFPPDTPEEWVAAETYQREGEDDEAIDYFNLFLPRIREAHPELEVYDFVQQPGETIFVPGGWWHAVLNIDVTIACTQNFASRENWDVVWRSTRYGRPDMAAGLLTALKEDHPELVARALELNELDNWDESKACKTEEKKAPESEFQSSDESEDEFIAQLQRAAPSSGSSSCEEYDPDAGATTSDDEGELDAVCSVVEAMASNGECAGGAGAGIGASGVACGH